MYFVYVLFSDKLNKRYVGSTSNVERRLLEHNNGRSKFTKGGVPWKLVHSEELDTISEARRRELYLKSGAGRKFLDELLKSMCSEACGFCAGGASASV
ncbi:MAG: GIY-YIG nuclease family protein [Bacteroidetes bacterium]|nr:GIY-YIG nuclease family protein [Bacteroidota bacterium]MCL5738803.1 GIY-YIG nuclease family protein [Bacteroidota bacterium]